MPATFFYRSHRNTDSTEFIVCTAKKNYLYVLLVCMYKSLKITDLLCKKQFIFNFRI